MSAARAVSQSARDKVLQLRPWCFCVVLATEKKYTVHIKYCKLNLLGCDYCDGVDKEAQTGFRKPQSKSLFVCATKCTTRLLASIYRKLVVTGQHYYT